MKALSTYKPKFYIVHLKEKILPISFLLFTILLVCFSKSNVAAAKSGFYLWANNVVPSLFPFFVATELLGYTNIINKMERFLTPIMKPLFNVSGAGAYPFIMGIISGYPIGAKIVTNFRQKNICNKEECERLLAFTNNSGPLFILGTVGISMFFNSSIGMLLFITHLLACITVGILFRFWKSSSKSSQNYYSSSKNSDSSFSDLGEILSSSIASATKTIVMIGGFVVLFSVIISILQNSNAILVLSTLILPIFKMFGISNSQFTSGFLSGLIELTNGLSIISSIPCSKISINIIIASILLGFGGISILLQVLSIVSKTDLSIKPYIIGKILHGIFSGLYTYIFINLFPIFNLNL